MNKLPIAPSPARRPLLVPALVAAAALAASGCASAPRVQAMWPTPPEKPRIQLLGSLRTGKDLNPGFGQRLLNALLPHDGGGEIASPSGLALSPDERRLYVACGGRGRVVVIDREARTMKLFTNKGLRSSIGVAVDADENVFVSDRLGSVIMVYDRRGAFVRQFGKDVLKEPTAIALDRAGQLLYVVNDALKREGEHRIEVFSLAGKHLRTLGRRGAEPGEFNFPSSLSVSPDGILFVSDTLNFRVQLFDRNGAVVGSFGQLGTGMAGIFDKIKGIAFDSFKNVYIVDAEQGVHILNASYRPLMLFGERPFTGAPGPIVIDSKNRIFVGDYPLNAVHEFQLINTTAADSYDSSPPPAKPGRSAVPAAAPTPPAVPGGPSPKS